MDKESQGSLKESPGNEVEVEWACDVKSCHNLARRVVEIEVRGRRNRGKPKRRWLDSVRDDIREKGLSGRKCTTVLVHGGVYHHTSTSHKSRTEMKGKKNKQPVKYSMPCRFMNCTLFEELHMVGMGSTLYSYTPPRFNRGRAHE